MNKQTLKRNAFRLAPVGALAALASTSSHAAIDIASVTSGIGDAQTAVLAVIAILTGMAVAVFAVKKVAHLFGR